MGFQSDKFAPLPQRWPASISNGMLIEEPVAAFLARNPRNFASATLTITGTVALNDKLNLTFGLPALTGGSLTKQITAANGDSTTALAQKMAAAICNDSVLQSYGAYATSLANVVTIYWPGVVGNSVVLTDSVSPGSEVETLSGQLANGSGPVIPFNTFRYSYNGQLFEFQANVPKIVAPDVVAALVRDSQAIV